MANTTYEVEFKAHLQDSPIVSQDFEKLKEAAVYQLGAIPTLWDYLIKKNPLEGFIEGLEYYELIDRLTEAFQDDIDDLFVGPLDIISVTEESETEEWVDYTDPEDTVELEAPWYLVEAKATFSIAAIRARVIEENLFRVVPIPNAAEVAEFNSYVNLSVLQSSFWEVFLKETRSQKKNITHILFEPKGWTLDNIIAKVPLDYTDTEDEGFPVFQDPDFESRIIFDLPPLTPVEVMEQSAGPDFKFFKCRFWVTKKTDGSLGGGLGAIVTKPGKPPRFVWGPLDAGDERYRLYHEDNSITYSQELVQNVRSGSGVKLGTPPEEVTPVFVHTPTLPANALGYNHYVEGYVEARRLRLIPGVLEGGFFAKLAAKKPATGRPSSPALVQPDLPVYGKAGDAGADMPPWPGAFTYSVLVELDNIQWNSLIKDAGGGKLPTASVDGDQPLRTFDEAGLWLGLGGTTNVDGFNEPVMNALKMLGVDKILQYYNVNVDFTLAIDKVRKQVVDIIRLLVFGNVKIEEAKVTTRGSQTIRQFKISVPVRFVDALGQWVDTFQWDQNLDAILDPDEAKVFAQTAAKRAANIDALTDKLFALVTSADMKPLSQYAGLTWTETQEETEDIATFDKLLQGGQFLDEFIGKVEEKAKVKYVERHINTQKTFSTSFQIKDIATRKEDFKTKLNKYEAEVSSSGASVFLAVPPGRGAATEAGSSVPSMLLPREPLKLKEGILPNIEKFYENLDALLKRSDFAYKASHPKDGIGTPGSPKASDYVEIGFDRNFKVIYVLFNGFPIVEGASYWFDQINDNERRYWITNSLVHRYAELIVEDESLPYDEFLKKYFVGIYIFPGGSLDTPTYEEYNVAGDHRLMSAQDLMEQNNQRFEAETTGKLSGELQAAVGKIESIRDTFWTNLPEVLKTINTIEDVYEKILNVVPLENILNQIIACSAKELAGANLQETLMALILNEIFSDYEENREQIDKIVKEVIDVMAASADCTMEILSSVYVIKGATEGQAQNIIDNVAAGALSEDLGLLASETSADAIIFPDEPPDYFINGAPENVQGVPLYTELPEAVFSDDVYRVAGNTALLKNGTTGGASTLVVLQKGDLVQRKSSSLGHYKVELLSQPNIGATGYIKRDSLAKVSFDDFGVTALLSDFVKVQVANETLREYNGRVYRRIRVLDNERNTEHYGRTGYVESTLLQPASEYATQLDIARDKLIFLHWGDSASTRSNDHQDGLDGEVTLWQDFLLTKPTTTFTATDGMYGPKTRDATKAWAAGSGGLTAAQKNDDIFKPLLDPGNVTIGAFRYFMRGTVTSGFEGKTLAEIEEGMAPFSMKILGNAAYAPPGFYTQATPPGGAPCVELFAKTATTSRYLDILKIKLNTAVGPKKPPIQKKIDEVKATLTDLLLQYEQCAKQNNFSVKNGRYTYIYKTDVTDEEIVSQDAYKLAFAVTGSCLEKKKALAEALSGSPVEEGAMAEVKWPGSNFATDAQLVAFSEWQACLNDTVEEQKDLLKDIASDLPESDQEKASVLDSLPDYPLPTSMAGVFTLFVDQGIIPVNISMHPQAGARFWKAFSSPGSKCFGLVEEIAELIIAIIEKEYPEVVKIIKEIITTFQTAMATYRTTRAAIESGIAMYKNFGMPSLDKFPIDGYDKQFKKVFYDTLKEAAISLISELVNSLLAYLIRQCNEQDVPSEEVAQVAKDIAQGYADDPGNISLLNDILAGYNFIVENSMAGDQSSSDALNVPQLIQEMIEGLSQQEICSIVTGNASEYLLTSIKTSLKALYPTHANVFDDSFITTICSVLISFVGVDYCLESQSTGPDPSAGYDVCDDTPEGSSDMSAEEAAAHSQQKLQDALDAMQKALDLMENPEIPAPDQCQIAKDSYLSDSKFVERLRKNIEASLFSVQKTFDRDITNYIPRLTNIDENFREALASVREAFPIGEGVQDALISGIEEAIGGEVIGPGGAIGALASKIAKDEATNKRRKQLDGLHKALSPSVVVAIVDTLGNELTIAPKFVIPPDADGERALEVIGRARAWISYDEGLDMTDYLGAAIEGDLEAAAAPSFAAYLIKVGQERKEHGNYITQYASAFRYIKLGFKAGELAVEGESKALPGETFDQNITKFIFGLTGIYHAACGAVYQDSWYAAPGLKFANATIDPGMVPGILPTAEVDEGNGAKRENAELGLILLAARDNNFNLSIKIKEEYLAQTDALNLETGVLLPELKEELLSKNIGDVVITEDSLEYNVDIDFDYTIAGAEVFDYSLLKSTVVSDSYLAKIKEKQNLSYEIAGGLAMDKARRDIIKEVVGESFEKDYYGIRYIKSLINDNLSLILDMDMEDPTTWPEGMQNKTPDFTDAVAKFLFDRTLRTGITKSINKAGESEFFSLSKMGTLTLAPTLKQVNSKCEDLSVSTGGNPSKSLLNIDQLSALILMMFRHRFNPCTPDNDALKTSMVDGYIIGYMRVFLIDIILKGIYASSTMKLEDILKDDLVLDYLFDKFIAELELPSRSRAGGPKTPAYELFKERAPEIVEVYQQQLGSIIIGGSSKSLLRKLFKAQVPVVADTFRTFVTRKFDQEGLVDTFIFPDIKYVVDDHTKQGGFLYGDDGSVFSLIHGPPEGGGKNLREAIDDEGGVFMFQKYIKLIQKKESAGANAKYRLDVLLEPGNIGTGPGQVGALEHQYLDQIKIRLSNLEDGSGALPYYILRPETVADLLQPTPGLPFGEELQGLIRECFTFSSGMVLNWATKSASKSSGEGSGGPDFDGGTLSELLASADTKGKFNIKIASHDLLPFWHEEEASVFFFPIKIIEKEKIEDITLGSALIVDGVSATFFNLLRTYMEGQGEPEFFSLEGDKGFLYDSLEQVCHTSGLFMTEGLKKEILESPQIKVLFESVVPLARYAAIPLIYTSVKINNDFDLRDLFSSTKSLLLKYINVLLYGSKNTFTGKVMVSNIIQDNESGADDELADIFSSFIVKALYRTPLIIVKGVAEMVDPNIALTKKIFDLMDLVTKLSLQLTLMTARTAYNIAKTVRDNAAAAAESTEGAVVPPEMPDSFDEWFEEEAGFPPPDPTVGIPWPVAAALAPALALSMMPSMFPYGVGFPPPPMFGPGVGPPMTPFAIPYLAFGLIKNGSWGSDAGEDNSSICPDIIT